jgi:methylated-DNA-[protein]-cysteine S-methyltransferase
MYIASVVTEIGPLHVVADDTNTVRAAGFGDPEGLVSRLRRTGQLTEPLEPRQDLGPVTAAVRAYLAGDVGALDTLAVDQPGGPFLQRCWKLLREVPAGETISYTELAARAGSPTAVRAAGQACARNLIAPMVPCHRVVASNGKLNGYAYGLPAKRWLIDHEASS